MSTNRMHPSFPRPFASAETSYPARDGAGIPEQRFILGSAQDSTYPTDSMLARNALGTTSFGTPYWPPQSFPVQTHGSTPNLMPVLNAPPRHPSPHSIPPYQLTQGPILTPPAFPMPQVHGTRVPQPTTPSYSPPPTVQTTHTPGHLNNTQVAPGLYSSYPSQAPIMSHSPLQHESGVLEVAHAAPRFQRNQDDSDDEEYQVHQGSPAMHDGNMRAKAPPSYVAYGVRDTVRMTLCPTCRRSYPESQGFCARCNQPQQ
ncbi:hypothetical protein EDB89DRAFT_1447814 [Lactarius sanguifluus]|nr:hypothetical protein EDB89DRAFT_1447814 [Lactarius sanguifluus]